MGKNRLEHLRGLISPEVLAILEEEVVQADTLAGGGGGGGTLLFQPGGAGAGPGVFSSWSDLYACLLSARAAAGGNVPIDIAIDDQFLSPAIVPAGIFELVNVRFVPAIDRQSELVFLSFAEGCETRGVRHFGNGSGQLIVRNEGTTTSPISDILDKDHFFNQGAFIDSLAGFQPLIDTPLLLAGQTLQVFNTDFASWSQSPAPNGNPALNIANAGATILSLSTNGGFHRGAVSGVVGSIFVDVGGASLWNSGPQPNMLGTILLFDLTAGQGPSRAVTGSRGAPLTAPTGLTPKDQAVYYDASGGAIIQTLPTLGAVSGFNSHGSKTTLIETSTTTGLSVAAPAGQFLNGVNGGSENVPGGGSITVTNDGIDSWAVESKFDPNALSTTDDKFGWVRIVAITVPGGSTANPVYQDPPGNTILQSIDVSDGTFDVIVESSFPRIEANGVPDTLPLVGAIYRGSTSVTLVANGPVTVQCINPDNVAAATDTVQVNLDVPPELLTLSFLGGYPGGQSELKAGDSYQITGTTDKLCDAIEIQPIGASDSTQLLVFPATMNFTVTMVIGDQGNVLQALPATGRARSSTTGALGTARATDELGGVIDGTDLVNLNNLFPTVVIGAITYPGGQQALKAAESATVANAVSDFDTILYDSPGAELTITSPVLQQDPKSVARLAGNYNVSIDNFRITANRAANDATTIDAIVVNIANVAATIVVTEPAARLRSGGSDSTVAQDHTITLTSDQNLLAAPTLNPDLGGFRGVFLAAFAGGPTVWTAQLRVLDSDEKGVFAWGALAATGLSGILTAVITGDTAYTLGGFVARTLTFAAFATNTAMSVEVVDFTKLQAGIFTSTNQAALKQAIATPPSVTNGYTIDALGINPTDVIWLDSPAAGANSGGTAQITNVEEVV